MHAVPQDREKMDMWKGEADEAQNFSIFPLSTKFYTHNSITFSLCVLLSQEPTTGLDSTTACNLIDMLQKYAARNSKTVITSIHQPSSQIFYKFDKLMLLSEGEVSQIIKKIEVYNVVQ